MFRYLWLDRQCKILISICRKIHSPHTHHTHLSLSQSAVCHHSQTAEERWAAPINSCDIISLLWLSSFVSSLPDTCLSNKRLWSQREVDCLTRSAFHPQTENHGSLGSSLHPTGTGICIVPLLVVIDGEINLHMMTPTRMLIWISRRPPCVNPTAGIQV